MLPARPRRRGAGSREVLDDLHHSAGIVRGLEGPLYAAERRRNRARARVLCPQTKGAPPTTASPSPAALGRTSPPFEEEPVNLHEAQDKPCNPTGRPHRGRPAFSLATSWESPAPKVGCLGTAGTRARAASEVSPLWSKGASVPVTADICGCQGVGRVDPTAPACHIRLSRARERYFRSEHFAAFRCVCQTMQTFAFIRSAGFPSGRGNTPQFRHARRGPCPMGTRDIAGRRPGTGPVPPLAGPAYPRTSKEMSPCSNVSTLSTIRRSVSIFSDVEHPGLYQMPPPISKP